MAAVSGSYRVYWLNSETLPAMSVLEPHNTVIKTKGNCKYLGTR